MCARPSTGRRRETTRSSLRSCAACHAPSQRPSEPASACSTMRKSAMCGRRSTLPMVPSCFPAYVRTLLLTAQRREEVSRMTWDEIDGDTLDHPASAGQQGHKTGDEAGDKVVPLDAGGARAAGQAAEAGLSCSPPRTARSRSPASARPSAALDEEIAELRAAESASPCRPGCCTTCGARRAA